MLMKNELNLEENKIYLRAKIICVPMIITTIYSFVIRGLEEFLDYFYSLPTANLTCFCHTKSEHESMLF